MSSEFIVNTESLRQTYSSEIYTHILCEEWPMALCFSIVCSLYYSRSNVMYTSTFSDGVTTGGKVILLHMCHLNDRTEMHNEPLCSVSYVL